MIAKVRVDKQTGIIRVDGIIVCKLICRDGRPMLQFKDGDRIRSNCRGGCYVEIPLDEFGADILAACQPETVNLPANGS